LNYGQWHGFFAAKFSQSVFPSKLIKKKSKESSNGLKSGDNAGQLHEETKSGKLSSNSN
jgi:hypothetical protein